MKIQPVSTFNYERYTVCFTRVTELLDDPADVRAVARMFIEELDADWGEVLGDPNISIVTDVEPLFPGDENREEIEYTLTVLMNPEDVHRLAREQAPYEFIHEAVS